MSTEVIFDKGACFFLAIFTMCELLVTLGCIKLEILIINAYTMPDFTLLGCHSAVNLLRSISPVTYLF